MTDLDSLKSGDYETQQSAFASLKADVYPICFRRLNGSFPQEIDDVVVDAMVKIFEQVDELKTNSDLAKATSRISTFLAIDRWRELKAKKRGEGKVESSDRLHEEHGDRYTATDQAPQSLTEDDGDAAFNPSASTNYHRQLDLNDIQNILETLQVELKLEHKEALNDFLLEELTQEEISQKRGWPKGTVGVYVQRGLEAMRKQRLKYPQLTKEAMQYIVRMLL